MTSRFVMPFADVSSGIKPPDGAKLLFFELDGITKKDTHKTKAATVANSNPVVADAKGVFPSIYITGDYLVTLTDKNNVQISNFGLVPINEFAVITDSLFVKNFDTLADAIASKDLVDGDTVFLKERATGEGGGWEWKVVLASTVSLNIYNTIVYTNVPVGDPDLALDLILEGVIKPDQWGVNGGVNDALAMQHIINTAPDNTVVEAAGIDVEMNFRVDITSKNNITIQNGNWHWNHQDNNMFQYLGVLPKLHFINMNIFGNGDAFPSQGCIGCPSGTVTTDLTIENCKFRDMPFGVYINADLGGVHTNPIVKYCKFINMVRDLDDISGMGNGLVFASRENGGSIINGKSSHNDFRESGRHSFYCSGGGNVVSVNDTFYRHRVDGSPLGPFSLAAMFIARDSKNVTITNPVFIDSEDIALSIQAVRTNDILTFGNNITVINPTFINSKLEDCKIGNDAASLNGRIDNIRITGAKTTFRGNSIFSRFLVLSGQNIEIDGILVTSEGSPEIPDVVKIEHTALSLTEFDNITIKNIQGTGAGVSSNGVRVNPKVIDGTLNVNLRLEDIDFGNGIFESVTPVNPNYLKLSRGKPVVFTAFTGAFTNKDAEINRVDKYPGKKLQSLSGGLEQPYFAVGSADTDVWVSADGTSTHAPA